MTVVFLQRQFRKLLGYRLRDNVSPHLRSLHCQTVKAHWQCRQYRGDPSRPCYCRCHVLALRPVSWVCSHGRAA